eukprot:TRINITY_DN19617_c0_g1_i1.p1 TRINITY_DN19617_c0_g1~~TRINITY_DN19617_c0_g1_i1.p1  ORF type:complete len:129 (-),score=6.86 TRINITY_DN19617_c0_g1_i1:56-442(-)
MYMQKSDPQEHKRQLKHIALVKNKKVPENQFKKPTHQMQKVFPQNIKHKKKQFVDKKQTRSQQSLDNIVHSRNHIIQRKRSSRSCNVLRNLQSVVINLSLALPLPPITPNGTHILHPIHTTIMKLVDS